MEKTVNQSTIPCDHRVSKMVRAFDTRMLDLSASEARASPADVSICGSGLREKRNRSRDEEGRRKKEDK